MESISLVEHLQNSSFGWFREALAAIDDIVSGSFSLPRVVVSLLTRSCCGHMCNASLGFFWCRSLQVVGTEKAGKSSILEAITKCSIFPRNTVFMTRCPVRFDLEGTPAGTRTQTTLTWKKKSMVLDRDEDVLAAIHEIFRTLGGERTSP